MNFSQLLNKELPWIKHFNSNKRLNTEIANEIKRSEEQNQKVAEIKHLRNDAKNNMNFWECY